jgi:hypothetical protein
MDRGSPAGFRIGSKKCGQSDCHLCSVDAALRVYSREDLARLQFWNRRERYRRFQKSRSQDIHLLFCVNDNFVLAV